MTTVDVNLKIDNGKLLAALSQAPRALHKNVSRAIQNIIQHIARSARINAPKANSTLAQSIIPRLITPLHGEVTPGVNYAASVETGTGIYGPTGRASGVSPPLADIMQWIQVKRIQPDNPAMEQRDLAFVIARSIAEKGTRAQPYMGPAAKSHQRTAQKSINLAIDKTLQGMA